MITVAIIIVVVVVFIDLMDRATTLVHLAAAIGEILVKLTYFIAICFLN